MRAFRKTIILLVPALLILLPSVASAVGNHSCITGPDGSKGVFGRPGDLPETFQSPDGKFLLHYTNTGEDAVPQEFQNGSTVPDFIVNAADYLDLSYRILADTLGYLQPPVDNDLSPEIDVYFLDLGAGYYGQTVWENSVDKTPRPHDVTSYMEIHNNFEGRYFYTNGDEALKVTCAHELFHVFQLGYGLWNTTNEELWFYETSSVWMEQRTFPEVKDYYQYFSNYALYWGWPMEEYSYDNAGFNMVLEKKFPGAMLDIWTGILSQKVPESTDRCLNERYPDRHWGRFFADWGLSMAACGDMAESGYSLFEDAEFLPGPKIGSEYVLESGFSDTVTYEISSRGYSQAFYSLDFPGGQPNIEMSLSGSANMAVQVLQKNGNTYSSVNLTGSKSYFPASDAGSEFIFCVGAGDAQGLDRVISDLYLDATSIRIHRLYPNPVLPSENQTMNVQLWYPGPEIEYRYSVYNILGRSLYSSGMRTLTGNDVISIGLSEMFPVIPASGVYFLVIDAEGKRLSAKFTIIK